MPEISAGTRVLDAALVYLSQSRSVAQLAVRMAYTDSPVAEGQYRYTVAARRVTFLDFLAAVRALEEKTGRDLFVDSVLSLNRQAASWESEARREELDRLAAARRPELEGQHGAAAA